MDIDIHFDDERVQLYFRDMQQRLQDMTPLMRAWSEDLRDYAEEAFETEGFGKWPDLSEITKRIRAEKGYDGKKLQQRGELAASIETAYDSESATAGTNKVYAPVHQFGATITPKNKPFLIFENGEGGMVFARKVIIPARPFLPESLEDLDKDQLQNTLKHYLNLI